MVLAESQPVNCTLLFIYYIIWLKVFPEFCGCSGGSSMECYTIKEQNEEQQAQHTKLQF